MEISKLKNIMHVRLKLTVFSVGLRVILWCRMSVGTLFLLGFENRVKIMEAAILFAGSRPCSSQNQFVPGLLDTSLAITIQYQIKLTSNIYQVFTELFAVIMILVVVVVVVVVNSISFISPSSLKIALWTVFLWRRLQKIWLQTNCLN